MDIKRYGKGCIPDTPDKRDYKASEIMGAVRIDWNIPFRLPEPPTNDQNGSLSCVSQSCSYYHWQLKGKEFSRRDLYAMIYQPAGGAAIRDGILRIVKVGQATRDEVPDPTPETETAMRSKVGITAEKAASDRELNGYVLPDSSIDGIAWAIQNYYGTVFGVTGSDAGWADMLNPRPPRWYENTWGHALYAMGYHLHDGQKCIITKSSWGAVNEHHIKENYFTSGKTFNGWTLIPGEKKTMTNAYIVKKGQEYGVTLPATSEASFISLLKNVGIYVPMKDEHLDFVAIDAVANVVLDLTVAQQTKK